MMRGGAVGRGGGNAGGRGWGNGGGKVKGLGRNLVRNSISSGGIVGGSRFLKADRERELRDSI